MAQAGSDLELLDCSFLGCRSVDYFALADVTFARCFPVSLFLCAVILSAWFGGAWPGLLATTLSALAFYYYFLLPMHSWHAKPEEIPRFAIFIVSALFVGSLSVAQRIAMETLKRARDDLKGTVQELQSTNEVLQAASRERDLAAVSLRRSEGYLAEAQRLAHMGSWVWQVPGRVALYLSDEWYRIYGFDPEKGLPPWEDRLQRIHPEDRTKYEVAIDRAIADTSDYEVEFRILIPDGAVKYIHTVGHPVFSLNREKLVEFVGTSMDVTDQKAAEKSLCVRRRRSLHTREPGHDHGRADRFPSARSESTNRRSQHQCQHLLALAHLRHSKHRRGPRCCHENRERRKARGRNYQPDPAALQERHFATAARGRQRDYSRDDCSSARRDHAIQHHDDPKPTLQLTFPSSWLTGCNCSLRC